MINPDSDLYVLVLIDTDGRESYHMTGALEDFWASPEHILGVGLAHGVLDPGTFKTVSYVTAEIRRRPVVPWETVRTFRHPRICDQSPDGHNYVATRNPYFGGAHCTHCGLRRDDS